MDTRICTSCHKTLPISKFHNYLLRDSLEGECIDCAHKRGATLRSQPGYNVWCNTKNIAKRKNIRYDEYAFSSYANFWDTFGDMWEAAEKLYAKGTALTVQRIDNTKGYFVSNCRVVASRQQPRTQTPEPRKTKVTPPPVKVEVKSSEKLHDVILNALSKTLNVTSEEIQHRIDLGWSLELLEQVGDDIELATSINKALEKKLDLTK